MAWFDTTQDPALRSNYVLGDKPYGAYWQFVKDESVPVAPPAAPEPMSDIKKLAQALVDAQLLPQPAVDALQLNGGK